MNENTWSLGAGRWCTYTEDYDLLNELLTLKQVERRAVYSKHGRDFGWDVMYPTAVKGKVRRLLAARSLKPTRTEKAAR